jgi:C1A family cysteine protease
MKTFFLIFVINQAFAHDLNAIFDNYLVEHKIRVGKSVEREQFRANFVKNYEKIESHNRKFKNGEISFELAVTKFAHLSGDDISGNIFKTHEPESVNQTWTGNLPSPPNNGRRSRTALPEYFNYADVPGVVHPVQDQGNCGSCYAFSAVGAIEGSMCRYHGTCVKLSEQEAMECTNGCNNGWDHWVYDHSKAKNGLVSSDYVYTSSVKNNCSFSAGKSRVPRSAVTSYINLPNDAEYIKNFLYNFGPLSVSLRVHENFYYYKSGIYSSVENTVYLGGHAVLLVGYGELNGMKYWILKNSFGMKSKKLFLGDSRVFHFQKFNF